MRKILADPLFIFVVLGLIGQAVLYAEGRRLRRRSRTFLVLLTGLTVSLGLLGTDGVKSRLIADLQRGYDMPDPATVAKIDVVVVLSGGFVDGALRPGSDLGPGGEPGPSTTARVMQGVRTFFAADARLLVVSGRARPVTGRGELDPARLAEGMKQLAMQMGVPEEQIVVEPRARTTREHPIELARLGLVGAGETVGVVTSSWHLPRAMVEFDRLFLRTVPVPAYDTAVHQLVGLGRWLPTSGSLAASAAALAEHVGTMWYRITEAPTPPR